MLNIQKIIAALLMVLSVETFAEVKIRLAHELPLTHYGHVYIDKWAKLVKERSNGEVVLQVFPSGQLYKDADAIQALNNGSLDMQLAVASYLSVVIPSMRLVDLPYLAPSPYDLPDLLDLSKPLGSYINTKAKEKGLNILAWWAAGDVVMVSTEKPINSTNDLKGMTFRVIGGAPAESSLKNLGVEPIHLSPVLLTTAVSQGTVQGFESTYSFWKIFPNAKYGTNAGTLSMLGYSVLASDRVWNGLSDKHRLLLIQSLKEITASEIEGVKELDKTDRELLIKQGRQITSLTPTELKKWKDLTEPVYSQFRKEIGNEVMDLLDKQRTK
jgi:C4-dicarboxylate-binding protein DctP